MVKCARAPVVGKSSTLRFSMFLLQIFIFGASSIFSAPPTMFLVTRGFFSSRRDHDVEPPHISPSALRSLLKTSGPIMCRFLSVLWSAAPGLFLKTSGSTMCRGPSETTTLLVLSPDSNDSNNHRHVLPLRAPKASRLNSLYWRGLQQTSASSGIYSLILVHLLINT